MHLELENAPESIQNFFRELHICVEDMQVWITDLKAIRDTYLLFKDAGDDNLERLDAVMKRMIFELVTDMRQSLIGLHDAI